MPVPFNPGPTPGRVSLRPLSPLPEGPAMVQGRDDIGNRSQLLDQQLQDTQGSDSPHTSLMRRLAAQEASIAVVGLGYVGLPLVRALAKTGNRILGYDIDAAKAEALNAGRSYIKSIPDAAIAEMRENGFAATSDISQLGGADVIIICVPTPLTGNREPDLSFVVSTAEQLVPRLRPGQLVVLESTTYPGTTAEVLKPILERSGLRSEDTLFIAYSPEREDPGNIDFDTSRIPKVVGGDGPKAAEAAAALYGQFVVSVVPVSTTQTAEAVKLTENIFRSVNIALMNELKLVYEAMGIDVWEVIEAARTKPFGFMPFYPGPGLGGHCIPIDPFYLTWKAREYAVPVRFVELAGEINTSMPRIVAERVAAALDARFGKGLNGSRILVVGLAYKKNVDDIRESPALRIIELLESRGATTDYHDPHVPTIDPTRQHARLAGRRSVGLDARTVSAYDLVLIVTDHDAIDWQALVASAKAVVDCRNATRHVTRHRERIVKA
jgi:UDP-N-acetyl-D-glucosamine dehydrogenase